MAGSSPSMLPRLLFQRPVVTAIMLAATLAIASCGDDDSEPQAQDATNEATEQSTSVSPDDLEACIEEQGLSPKPTGQDVEVSSGPPVEGISVDFASGARADLFALKSERDVERARRIVEQTAPPGAKVTEVRTVVVAYIGSPGSQERGLVEICVEGPG